eukprot:TRINITY_DN74943_c0_g1_i1.p1 TRINITY_DN74943_c0_g1~~TRINITY_DN74943_c0_g1_i1.p1  ORF type:complete len:592 (+),score=97.15 TRINITY_DN74943_c0_g1_i1:150-1778(+)
MLEVAAAESINDKPNTTLSSTKCLPESAQAAWRSSFETAILEMLKTTPRSMQVGLGHTADSVVSLAEAVSSACGNVQGLALLKERAARLKVLASIRSLGRMGSKVKYEPREALVVGGVDVHRELNDLILAWRLSKGAHAVGKALAEFLRDFRMEDAATEEPTASDKLDDVPAPAEAPAPQAFSVVPDAASMHVLSKDDQKKPRFWAEVLTPVIMRFGGGHEAITEDCIKEEDSRRYADAIEGAIQRMIEKHRKMMGTGLRELAVATEALVVALEASCTGLAASKGASRLKGAAKRLTIFASAKTLVNFGVHVEYEPMKVLKVGGIDVHSELNRFIRAWINQMSSPELAGGMGDFFEDFFEGEAADDDAFLAANPAANAQETDVFRMFSDAVSAAEPDGKETLNQVCIPAELGDTFAQGVDTALDHMLQKRKRSMQLGLKELADVTLRLLDNMPDKRCGSLPGVAVIRKAAAKLGRLTRRTVVDYGTHIKYEAMQSLSVGGVAVHRELNAFISKWKLNSRISAGTAFGELMLMCSTISGHDEL